MTLIDFLKLMRPQQWYKNLLIFLPLIFVNRIFDFPALLITVSGLVSLILVSSANYIINDIFDLPKDRLNHEKKNRPLASGRVKVWQGLLVAVALVGSGLLLAWILAPLFFGAVLALLVLSQLYTFAFKKEMLLDILSIGMNFVIRAASGAFIINVKISPWLILCTFFLSLFLSIGKRHAEVLLLGKQASAHRATLKQYTEKFTSSLMLVVTTLLLISYSLYSFMSEHVLLLFTLPLAFYVILRYLHLVYAGSDIARHPERVWKDQRMLISIFLWITTTVIFIRLS